MDGIMSDQMLPELEEVEHPPGPGPGLVIRHGPGHPEEEDVMSEYLHLHPPISPRLPHNNFIGAPPPPPPVPMMDYQSDHSSNFTQTFLRGILTSIDSKDPVVANAWLETLLDAIDLLPIEVIKQEIIIIAINKSQLSQPPFSRLAACKILGKLSTKLDQQAVRQEILPSSLALCQDVESEVRTCMCRQLAFVARGIGLELTKSAILPVLVELSNDETAEVRLSAIETVVHLLSLLDDEICNNTIVPLVMKSCDQARALEDCTLPVIARHLGRLCHGLTPNLSQEQKSWFISYYQQLSRLGTTASTEAGPSNKPMPDLVPRSTEDKSTKYTECRQACAYNLPGMVLFVGINNFSDKLFSTFCDFAADPSPLVRKTLAASLHELIKIIGTNFSLLKMQIVALFNDTNIEVLSAMVLNMVYVIDALARFGVLQFGSTSSYSQELSLAILNMEEIINATRSWRLHSDCLEKLSCLANCISASVIQNRYIPLLFLRAQKSRPLPSRVAAVRTLLVILRFTVKQSDRTSILQRIKTEFARGKSCHSRMLFLKMCEMALCLFSKLYFKTHLFSEFLCLGQDSVANIRLKVVSLLPQLKALLVLPADSEHLLHLEETIKELLVVETDRDVLGALQTSIHHLAEVETAMDGMSKLCLYSEEDIVDDRKLREERLIANMEEQIKQVQGAKFEQLMTPSAIPSRLRSLGMDRKRSESLPPALTRGDQALPAAVRKPRFNSPEPQRYPEMPSPLSHTQDTEMDKPSFSQDIWRPDNQFEEKDFKVKNNPGPFSSSLENLDTQDSSFLVDAGIKLPTMSSAASMPNLTSVGKVKDQLSRSNSIPESNSNIDGELAKYLISNEEMEHYEAEYHKAAQESLADRESPGPSRARGRSESRMKPPSFTSALISRPVPSATAISVSVNKSPISFSKPIQKTEKQEVRMGLKPVSNKSNQSARNSPPKSTDERTPNQQRWNDGSIERLAEKWAAKRDALLKETGVIAENLQQRKAAMEQKLESVKRSIPKRSMGFTPQSAQKRLSLCETTVNQNKSEQPGKDEQVLIKRKSLDVDIVIAPTESTSEESDEDNTSGTEADKSAELGSGSSDSDDSLPPYPAMEKQSSESEQPLPPPPPTLDCSTSSAPLPPPPPPPTTSAPQPPASSGSQPAAKTSPNPSKPSSRLQMFSSPSLASMATFKTVTAPQTSVAVSRQLPAPMRSIADSPRLPLPSKSPSSLSSFKKSDAVEPPSSKISGAGSSIKPPAKKSDPSAESHKLKIPQKNDCRTADGNNPGTDSSVLHINRPMKRVSKIATTQISSINRHDTTSFSSFKGQKCPEDSPSVEQKAGKTIVYIENNTGNKLKTPSSILTKERSKMLSPKPQEKSQSAQSQSQPSPSASRLKPGRYGGKSLSMDSGTALESSHSPPQVKSFLARSTNKIAGSKSATNGKSPMGSTESVVSPVVARVGPRRSLGMRMWQQGQAGQGRRTPTMQQSPNNSRSPSPAPRRSGDTSIMSPSLRRSGDTSTLSPSLRRSGDTSTLSPSLRRSGDTSTLSPSLRRSGESSPFSPQSRNGDTSTLSPSLKRSDDGPALSPSLKRSGDSSTSTSTLPRTSNISRLRGPGLSYAPQRRSYGGVSNQARAGSGKTHSAPSTPRHSQADLAPSQSPGGSRSSSPVILRRHRDNQDTPAPSNLRPQHQLSSMLKRPTSAGQDIGSSLVRPTTFSRPSTRGTSTQPPPVKSRLQNPAKSFGFSY